MPRPNKPINPGRLEDPVANSRGSRWAKHAGPEHADQYEPDGSILIDGVTQETVAHIDLTAVDDATVEMAPVYEATRIEPVTIVPARYQWESNRSIDGRTYHRLDTKVALSDN